MAIKDSTLTVKPQDTLPEPESYSIYGWPTKLREEYLDKWRKENPSPVPLDFRVDEEVETFTTPPGYDAVPDHQANFFKAVRSRKRSEEHTSELQSQSNLVCRLLLEKKKSKHDIV